MSFSRRALVAALIKMSDVGCAVQGKLKVSAFFGSSSGSQGRFQAQFGSGAFYPGSVAKRSAAGDAMTDSIAVFTGNIAINQLRPIRRKDNRAVAQAERLFEAFAGGKA